MTAGPGSIGETSTALPYSFDARASTPWPGPAGRRVMQAGPAWTGTGGGRTADAGGA
jgi:hypothetical protein